MDWSDEVLLALLWRLRRKISTRSEILIPPSWIFTDAELKVIAHERPTTMEALRRLPGSTRSVGRYPGRSSSRP